MGKKVIEYDRDGFDITSTPEEMLVEHPACEFLTSLNPKFPTYHLIKHLLNEIDELEDEIDEVRQKLTG